MHQSPQNQLFKVDVSLGHRKQIGAAVMFGHFAHFSFEAAKQAKQVIRLIFFNNNHAKEKKKIVESTRWINQNDIGGYFHV